MNNKTPKLRFKGFTDAWEQRKLDDICKNITDGSHFSPTEVADGYPMPSVKDMTESGFDYQTSKKISKEDFNILVKQGCKPEIGDVLVAKDGSILKYAFEVKEKQEVVVLSSIAIFKPKKAIIDGGFLAQYFKIEEFKRRVINENTTGTGVPRIVLANFKKFEISFPGIEEQKKISKFLEKIDNLITLHQRKLEKIKSLKKAYLDKMFPKKGKLYPELRFAGFTDAWEQRKFGELYRKSSEKNDGRIGIEKNITVATMQFKNDIKVTNDDYLKTYYTFNKGDIAFEGHQSKEYRFGRFVENDIGDGIVSHIFAVFRPIVDYDLMFWKYAINNENLMQRILSRSTKASTMMHDLVAKDFLEQTFLVPTVDEQKKIGAFFSNFDSLITLHQRKLEKLKQLKTGYLNSMFI